MNPAAADTKKSPAFFKDIFICATLMLAIFMVYRQLGSHEFINFDDHLYVSNNPMVRSGLSWEGVKWAFGFTGRAYWHPLTWVSHMLDSELFGMNPGMHHLMSMFLHMVNSLLLYVALRIITDSFGSSAFVAFLFALHPVNVDSVAWLAERKNLLSATFSILTVLVYACYSRKPGFIRYLLTLFTYLLGILAKPPTLVALPFALLLLDYWPLRRIAVDFPLKDALMRLRDRAYSRLILRLIAEKIPLLIMSIGIILISLRSSSGNVDVITPDIVSYSLRIENALVSYVLYIGKLFWPHNLTIYYPFPASIPFTHVVLSSIVLLGVTAASIACIKKYPYFFTGWFWYLGTLVPVSGLMQVGLWPAMAERWVYVPAIGLFIAVSWFIPEMLPGFRLKKIVLYSTSMPVLLLCAFISWNQASYWKNDLSLFSHAVQVNRRNNVAYSCLGDYYTEKGDLSKALEYYQAAMDINPNDPTSNYNLGIVLLKVGRFDEAAVYLEKATQKFSSDEQLYLGLGVAYTRQDRIDDAMGSFRKAVEINPESEARKNLQALQQREQGLENRIASLEKKLAGNPRDGKSLHDIAVAYSVKGDLDFSLKYLNRLVEIQPDNPDNYYNIACVYAKKNKVGESVSWMEKAIKKGFKNYDLIRKDPDLENIRNTAFIRDILKSSESKGME
jgi:tetratricopeptide (TPR) repeat protein